MTDLKRRLIISDIPSRCIDPVIKYCQGCCYGQCVYPEWVETYEDLDWCTFETNCLLGYDKGRQEDEPTDEELREFEERFDRTVNFT